MGTPWCVCRPVDLTYISLCLLLQVLPTVTANNLSILSSLTFHATPLFAELCNEVYLRQHSCHTLCSRAAYPLCSHSIYTSTQSFYWEIHTETATIIFFFFIFLNNDGEKAWHSDIFDEYPFCMKVSVQIKDIWHRLSKNPLLCAVSWRKTYIWGHNVPIHVTLTAVIRTIILMNCL